MRIRPGSMDNLLRTAIFFMILCGIGQPSGPVIASDVVFVYFETDSAELTGPAVRNIQSFARHVRIEGGDNVLVIGHSDSTGSPEENLALSRRRATAVAEEFIRAATVDPQRVRAVGYGSRAFDGKPKTKANLAKSRRAEIHTMAIPSGYPLDLAWIRDHNSVFVYKNLDRARRFLFEKKIELALLALKEAEQLGGRSYAGWHLIYGAIGYYEGLNPARLKEIFQTAVRLDPYNATARDYYERARARDKFYRAQIRPDMGRREDAAIRVNSLNEAFEYLRLFNVSPLHRIQRPDPHFETWVCANELGEKVVYHFRTETASRWAYTR